MKLPGNQGKKDLDCGKGGTSKGWGSECNREKRNGGPPEGEPDTVDLPSRRVSGLSLQRGTGYMMGARSRHNGPPIGGNCKEKGNNDRGTPPTGNKISLWGGGKKMIIGSEIYRVRVPVRCVGFSTGVSWGGGQGKGGKRDDSGKPTESMVKPNEIIVRRKVGGHFAGGEKVLLHLQGKKEESPDDEY